MAITEIMGNGTQWRSFTLDAGSGMRYLTVRMCRGDTRFVDIKYFIEDNGTPALLSTHSHEEYKPDMLRNDALELQKKWRAGQQRKGMKRVHMEVGL